MNNFRLTNAFGEYFEFAGPARPLAYCEEGGLWIGVSENPVRMPVIMLFDDGSIYDQVVEQYNSRNGTTVSPWRKLEGYKPHIRVKMGRAVQ